MSEYIEYLNNNPNIDYKTFLKVCAWNIKELEKFKEKKIKPIEDTIENVMEQNLKELELAEKELERLSSLTAEEEKRMYEERCVELNHIHKEKLQETQKLISSYNNILTDLCCWKPTNMRAKTLKDFAIKELTNNMPVLATYSSNNVPLNSKVYINELIRKQKTKISTLEKNIEANKKIVQSANKIIEDILIEIEFAPETELQAKKEEPIKEEYSYIKI